MISSKTLFQKAPSLPFGHRNSFSLGNFKFRCSCWDFSGISCLLPCPSVCSTVVLLLTIHSPSLPHIKQIFLWQAWAGGPPWAKPYFSPTVSNLPLLLLNPPTLILWYITHLQLFVVLTMVFSLNCLSSSLNQASIRTCWERSPWSGGDYKLCQWKANKQLGSPEDQIEHQGSSCLHVSRQPLKWRSATLSFLLDLCLAHSFPFWIQNSLVVLSRCLLRLSPEERLVFIFSSGWRT